MPDFSKYEIVSFDLFDTLVKRDVRKPTDVFKIVQKKLRGKYDYENYPHERRMAEVSLYKKKQNEEITIDEIYDNFPARYTKDSKEAYKKMEMDVEYEICNFNERLRKIYNDIEKSKKIIIITDIYLPKELIENILKKCNICYDELFVSSEIRFKKNTGNLFKYALNKLKVSPDKIIHIGDNIISDYKIPKSIGISTYKIKKEENNSIYNSISSSNTSFEYSILSSFINNRLPKIDNRFEKIGYETLGPLLFGYSKWLSNFFEKNKYDKIFFLSRDGQIMKKSFELLDISKEYPIDYYYASRRALIVPNLKNCNNISEMFDFFTFPKYISLNSIIKKLGLDPYSEAVTSLAEKHDVELNKVIHFESFENLNNKYKSILNDLYSLIVVNSKKEYINEMKYISNMISKDDKRIAIVDIGWYGNMQINLEKTLKSYGDFSVNGYYIGLVPKLSNKNNLKMIGYLFNTNDKDYEKYIREKNFNSLFELLFSADHGTVIKYRNDKEVDLGKYEYSVEQLKKIQMIQAGALKFIEDISNNTLIKNIKYSVDDASYNIYNLGNNPTYIDSKKIGDFLFLDNKVSKISNYNGDYLFKVKKLIDDFKLSQWKIAFLRLLFKIDLPYERICRFLRGNKIR